MTVGFGFLAGLAVLFLVLAVVAGFLAGRLARAQGHAGRPVDGWEAVEDAKAAGSERERRLRAEVAELRAALVNVADRKDAEMGRLETAAIEALESTNTAYGERIALLEDALRATASVVQEQDLQLAEQQHRIDRLRSALAERDRLLAEHPVQARDRGV
ncbi:hypothetical protein KZZ52_23980 [Dactylosporangium sp. AC04546]|uniref:hypothetical protein n=1 Tax=Dactylosporangium sp. AC04546 TaxID=2862460 RepID=UPI001EDE0C5D|nr:hypothetical protein [Dactylosporangium sp. AC04546]WVK88335.1 hypothetical protein KZZ52_23980 [Dactylosporangium sp. AC04546]